MRYEPHPPTIEISVLHLMILCALHLLFPSLPCTLSVCRLWLENRLCVVAGEQFIRSISGKTDLAEVQRCWRRRDGWRSGLHTARFQPAALFRAGLWGALWMRLLVVSGESETVERRKKGLMVLCWAHLGRSQTRVPGLALSCPYHCTSANSEHRGLLRKQLSLKDLQGEHRQHKDEDFRRTWVTLNKQM